MSYTFGNFSLLTIKLISISSQYIEEEDLVLDADGTFILRIC